MNFKNFSCPGGNRTQTGLALKERYGVDDPEDCGDIAGIKNKILDDCLDSSFVCPIWNSHEGEVPFSTFVWDYIQDENLKIQDIWPRRIRFLHFKKEGQLLNSDIIGSVKVAKTQCSEYIKSNKLDLKYEYKLTTYALDDYINGKKPDMGGVFVAENTPSNGFDIISESVANYNNFTSFVTFCNPLFFNNDDNHNNHLTGVKLSSLENDLTYSDKYFFDQVFVGHKEFDNIPKLIFIFNRYGNSGLIFEGPKLNSTELIDLDHIDSRDVEVYEDVGITKEKYSKEVRKLIQSQFEDLDKYDFFLHLGKQTCLFGCPALDIYIHGFDANKIESAVRVYISKVFELMNNKIQIDKRQKEFFEKHYEEWNIKRSKFMKFQIIN